MKLKYLTIAAAFVATTAVAGYLQPAPVQVTLNGDGSGAAIGDMVTARFSDNDVEHIGCGIRVFPDGVGGTFDYAFCQARDAAAQQAFCTTTNKDLIDGFRSVADFSFITFAWDTNGECVSMGSSTQSFYMPDFRDQGLGAPGNSGGRGR